MQFVCHECTPGYSPGKFCHLYQTQKTRAVLTKNARIEEPPGVEKDQ